MDSVNGIFLVRGIYSKEKISSRLVIAGALTLLFILLFINFVRGLAWWGAGIFAAIFLLLLSYIVSVLRKKHGIYMSGFLIKGDQVQRGELFATTEALKTLIDGSDRKMPAEAEIAPQTWKESGRGVVYANPESTRFAFSIANQENFQSTYNVAWHVSKIELLEGEKTKSLLLLYPGKLCVVNDNQAFFHFQKDESKNGELLLSQLSLLGNRLKKPGASAWSAATVKVVPGKTNKATALAFGAIGALVASVKDEKKKKKFKEDLKAGTLSLISGDVDRALLNLIEELNWDITV